MGLLVDHKLRLVVQDYKEAARLRDSLRSFEEEEPVLRLRRLMKKAIEEERFEVFSLPTVPKQFSFMLKRIGSIAFKDHYFWKIPLKDLAPAKYQFSLSCLPRLVATSLRISKFEIPSHSFGI